MLPPSLIVFLALVGEIFLGSSPLSLSLPVFPPFPLSVSTVLARAGIPGSNDLRYPAGAELGVFPAEKPLNQTRKQQFWISRVFDNLPTFSSPGSFSNSPTSFLQTLEDTCFLTSNI